MKKLGFIGLGIMGKPMILNLIRAKQKVFVYDLNEHAVSNMKEAGAIPSTLGEIGSNCDVIFLSLPNGYIVENVLFESGGLINYLKSGTIIVDTSSILPTQSKDFYNRLKSKNISFIDSPVSGGEPKAIDGTLAFMAGGDEDAFDEIKEYMLLMGSSAVLVGESGSGCVTKLANQIIVNNTIATVSEAFVLAAKAGANPLKVYEAIRGGLVGSTVLDAKIPMIVARNFVPGGKISINYKDIKNVIDAAHALDVPVPLTSQLFEIFQYLKVHGYMEEDHSAMVKYFEKLADVEVG